MVGDREAENSGPARKPRVSIWEAVNLVYGVNW